MTGVEVACACECELGEGPLWDHRIDRLLFVDIAGHAIHAFDPVSGDHVGVPSGEYVSAVALNGAGGWLAALQHDVARFTIADGIVERLVAIEAGRADTRFNDGAVDSRGRLWLGTLSLRKERQQCALYKIEREDAAAPRVTQMLDGVTNSNGIDWSPDDRRMYYVDTGTRRIDVFDFDADAGVIDARRTLVEFPPADGKPDGLIVDADGCLWVAMWQGSAIRRYTPDGRLDRHVALPVSCPTKCAFGGAGLTTLFITTARAALSPDERRSEPLAGHVLAVHPGVSGRPAYQFGTPT